MTNEPVKAFAFGCRLQEKVIYILHVLKEEIHPFIFLSLNQETVIVNVFFFFTSKAYEMSINKLA